MFISALDKQTAKLLTTTQIITSVYTAAKELIENALDANAKNIEVTLVGYGSSLIEVKDNGCGVPREDITYMTLPSYTSKISSFEDLGTLKTYGFRGEALNAICAVAEVVIITKTTNDETAMSYTMNENGNIMESEPCHQDVGTTIRVKDIFKKFPVRRQIITNMRKANQDVKLLESLIKGLGICKPSVRMSYRVNNNVVFVKPKMRDIKETTTYILGKKVMSFMEWIEYKEEKIWMQLLIPCKEIQDVSEVFTCNQEYVFVNDRVVRHKEIEKTIRKTLVEYFAEKFPIKKKLLFLLYMLIDSKDIDVNLEPNKNVISLKDEREVINAIDKCLKNYYGIGCVENDENSIYNDSINSYQDYTSDIIHTEDEWRSCKKRKLIHEEHDKKSIEENKRIPENYNNNSDAILYCDNTKNDGAECHNPNNLDAKLHKDNSHDKLEIFTHHLIPPNLSDSDSNDLDECETFNNKISPHNVVIDRERKENDDFESNDAERSDLPRNNIENTKNSHHEKETLSQLPVVHLGEDFWWEENTRMQDNEENTKQDGALNGKMKNADQYNINDLKDNKVSLETWSKGHLPELKGGTDIVPCNGSKSDTLLHANSESTDELSENPACKGFIKFSKTIRAQILKQNPNLTSAQIAQKMIEYWKKLSSEERGYYRDLAFEESEMQEKTRERCKKSQKEVKNKKMDPEKRSRTLLNMFQKIKDNKMEKKENLVMRTTMTWDINQKKVADSFINRSNCMNSNLVVGSLTTNLWVVQNNVQIWIVDISQFMEKLNVPNLNHNQLQMNAESIERYLKQWFLQSDDMSMMFPIYTLQTR